MRSLPWFLVLLSLCAGCPRTGPEPSTLPEEDGIATLPADEALLEIARRRAIRDAAAEVVPMLRHPDTTVVCAALRALGQMGRPEALEPVLYRLFDEHAAVRVEAAFALSLSWSWSVDDETQRLLLEDRIGEALGTALESEEDPAVRCAIARAMGSGAGADVWSDLEEMVLAGEGEERKAALQGMSMLGRREIAQPITGELLDPLLPALVVADPKVQWWCTYLLMRCPLAEDPAVRQRTHEALVLVAGNASSPEVLAMTARAIAAVGEADAVAALGRLLGQQPPARVRLAVARGLARLAAGQSPDPLGAELMCTLAADPDPGVREAAAAGLASASPELAVEALAPLLTDGEGAVRAAAASSVGALEPSDAMDLLRAVAADPQPFVRAARASALAQLDDPAAWEELSALAGGDQPLVRLTALEAMAATERPEARPFLLAALSGTSPAEAVVAVDGLGAADDGARASLLEAYDRWTGFDGWEVRRAVIAAVVESSSAPPGWLDEAVRDPDEFVRRAAARAIRQTGRSTVARAEPAPELSGPLWGIGDARTARIETSRGPIVMELFVEQAPATVASFVALAEAGFHDGLSFHRVVPGFVIQGGDPDGTGWGGPGYRIRSEFNPVPYEPGTLGMARAPEPDTEGSQWFITHDRQPHLDGHYTVFGRVTEGMEVVHSIRPGDQVVKLEIIRGD